jgi:hypothetical protein
MSEAQEHTTAGDESAGNATSDQIARSMGSVWQRFSGQRPKSTSVEIERNVVRCVIEEGTADAADEDAEPVEPGLSPDSPSFSYNATAVITRATGRRVVAFIPKRDKKAQTSTQTFILDQPRQRF